MMRSTSSIDTSKYLCGRTWLQCFALFFFCLGALGTSAQNHPKEIQEIPPMELINPIERLAIEADHSSAVLDTKVGQETQPHISKFVAPTGMLKSSNVMLATPSTKSHPSAVPDHLDHYLQTFGSAKQRALNQRRGRSSSAPGDMDNDGIPDSLDLCPDHMDTALDFDGIDDFVTVPHDLALNVGGGDFTFEAWLHPASNQYIPILTKAFSPSTGTNYTFDITPTTSSTYNIRLFYANDIYLNTTPIPLNEWNHVAVTFNFTTKQAIFYLNGVADGMGIYSQVPDTTSTQSLFIGRSSISCCNSFEGRMDDVSIWNTVRTASEIADDMTSVDVFATGLVMSFDMNESPACIDNTSTTTILDQSQNNFVGQLNNFSLLPGCTSNWSSGRNLDSDQNGLGDGCDYECNTVLYVDSSAIGGNNLGTSWADAYVSLSEALNHAGFCPDIDSIHVAAGTYLPYIGGLANPRSATFAIPAGVQILGQFPSGGGNLSARDTLHETILSGDIGTVGASLDNVYHVVTAANMSSQSSVDGFTITKGLADGGGNDNNGAGWYSDSASVVIRKCMFIDNQAIGNGGGFYAINDSASLLDCQFISNTAYRGGGACIGYFMSSSSLIAQNVLFTDNSADRGGGIYSFDESVSLTDCQFSANTAIDGGGGVYLRTSSLIAQNLLFSDNSAYEGGGIYAAYQCDVFLLDCQFSTNTAEEGGGGVYMSSSSLVAQNVLFTDNSAEDGDRYGRGGGLYSSTTSGSETITLTDCQFNSNTALEEGGGAYLGSPLVAHNVTFTGNTALEEGGGLHSSNVLSLTDCQFKTNTASVGGGGMRIKHASHLPLSLIKNCTFNFNEVNRGDTTGSGGACQISGTGQTDFVNCLFEANQAQGAADNGGGAIMIYGGDVDLVNSTIVNNHSASLGGAISIFDNAVHEGALNMGIATLTNTVLWNNTATTDSIIYIGNGGSANINHSLLDANNCLPNVSCGPGMIYNENPLFIDSISTMPMGGDFRLRYKSPAINAGINDSIPSGDTTDLNGLNRIINTIVDMGAYEFNYDFPCGVYGNLVIDDVPVFMGDYKASGLISSAGIINTNSNGTVSFKSESEIELNQGFEVQLGEIFNAVIEDPCVD